MPGPTIVAAGDAKAQKKWSGELFIDYAKKSYFERKFTSEDANTPIQRLTDLESDAGDTITYDLSVKLRNKPTSGDNRLQGKAEALRFYTDSIAIDQLRHIVSAGGKMSRKRTVHNMRSVARDRLGDYWSQYVDEMFFMYLSGARGINEDFIEDTAYVGHAGNPLNAPDTSHILYPGTVTGKNNLAATDKMTRAVVEKAQTKAAMLAATDVNNAVLNPIMINGESHYVCVMSKFQEYDMRTADTTGWLDIQKAAAAAEGRNNPIFKGGLGMINDTVLHSHQSAIRFSDYGAGSNVAAARAIFMGRQAAVVAFGATGGFRFNWHEEMVDHDNELEVSAAIIFGLKKARFNSRDFGNLSIDTAAKDPN